MATQICLPGSNNQHTSPGREIDTWDREFNGRDGSGCYEAHEHVDPTKLTKTGYQRDGFVVDDKAYISEDESYSSEEEFAFLPPEDESGVTKQDNAVVGIGEDYSDSDWGTSDDDSDTD